MQPRGLVGISSLLHLAALALAGTSSECQCGHFVMDSSTWSPLQYAFGSGEKYQVNCSSVPDIESVECRLTCEEEVFAINQVFSKESDLLQQYPPEQSLPCDRYPRETGAFYRACGSQKWFPVATQLSVSVCCHPRLRLPVWCETLSPKMAPPAPDASTPRERKLDTDRDQHAVATNEIDLDSTKLVSSVKKPPPNGFTSWLNTLTTYLGYSAFDGILKDIDIFTLPTKIQELVKVYKDEVSMGQCYVEYATYLLFERNENPFDLLLRNRRGLDPEEMRNDAKNVVKQGQTPSGEVESARSYDSKERAQPPLMSLISSGLNLLGGSSSQSSEITSIALKLLPIVAQVYTSDDPDVPISNFIKSVMGSYISEKRKPSSENVNSVDSKNPAGAPPSDNKRPPSPGASMSPITSLVLDFVKYYMGNYMSSLPGSKVPKPAPLRPKPEATTPTPLRGPPPPPPRPPAVAGGGLGSLLKLFMDRKPSPSPPKPSKTQDLTLKETTKEPERKDFSDMLLEFIRPVFISIVGKSPGGSGVEEIREVYHLSTLGRVDNPLVEEVVSPYFCMRNYAVNKAWTITERGVRSILSQFDTKQQERMMRMLQEEAKDISLVLIKGPK